MAREPIVIVEPAKPVDEMTDEELDAFSEAFAAAILAKLDGDSPDSKA